MATVERTRPVQLARSHTHSMNSSGGSQKSSESKSSASELLSITDAAVKALEKTKATKVKSYDIPAAGASSVMEEGIRLLSPREICVVTPGTFEQDLFSPVPSMDGSLTGRLSVGSQSTTAGEVLIHATESNLDVPVSYNVSHTSNTSNVSQTSSTFLTGQAKPVKVSAKKLKEIQSPFEVSKSDHSMSVSENVQISSNTKQPGTGSSKAYNESRDCPTNKRPKVLVGNDKVYQTDLSKSSKSPKKGTDENFGLHTMDTQLRSLGKDSGRTASRMAMADSGYMTQSVQVVREMGHPLENTEELNATLKSAPSLTEDMYPGNMTCDHSDSPIDIVAQENYIGNSDDSTGLMEIITVPGNSPNISSDRGSSQSTAAEVSPRNLSDKPGDRFSKFQTSGLKQGMLTDVQAGLLDADSSKDQVHITQYSLSDKHKMLRKALVNRGQGSIAIKKQVTPKVIPRTETQVREESGSRNISSINDAATTAAVAAASAVAATQPFLKAQQDMEMRIAELMQKIGGVGSQTAMAAAGSDTADRKHTQKMDHLEHQLTDLTQRRLDYLEEMQKQQMQWQAQLLSISRDPKLVAPPGEFSHQMAKHPVQPSVHYKPREHMSSSPKREMSALDTPAPRRKPPTPAPLNVSQKSEARGDIMDHVTPERKQYRGGAGLLAQILADDESRNRSTFPETPQSGMVSHRPEDVSRHAGELVQELGEIKTQMKNVVRDVQHWKHDLHTEAGPRVAPRTSPAKLRVDMGPAPLDEYLTKKGVLPTSPYPQVKDRRSQANAPVHSNFADASEILHKVAISRNYLEANLESITRNRQESDVYNLLQQAAQDHAVPERLRIQKMVDEHIEDMNHSLEREVMEELLKVQENKHSTAKFMIPERDTTGVMDRSKAKVIGPKAAGTKVAGVRGRPEARIDTGLRRFRSDGAPGSKVVEKENLPSKRPKKTKGSKVLESATYRSRVYGNSKHSPQRATQKEPYLRFQTSSPKSKSPKALGRPTEAKGVLMASTRTQAGSGYIPPTDLTYHSRGHPQAPPTTALPQMVPMAIPLGAPRKEGGLTAPIVFPARPFPGPLTSTPMDDRQPNIGALTLKDRSLQEEEERVAKETKKAPKLDIQTLPSVDIDSVISVSSAQRSKVSSPIKAGNDMNYDLKTVTAVELSESSVDDDEDTITEEDSAPIDLAGYQAPSSTYHGPQFPPQAPPLLGAPPTSHVLATDLKRRDLLQNQAVDWVEQELMARVLSEFYANRQEAVPHMSMVARVTRSPRDTDDSDTDISEVSGHDSLIAEGLGQDGLQLFVDAGQPVDDKLVSALLKEVILEKISSVVGAKTSTDDEGGTYATTDTRGTPKPSPRRQKQNVVSQPEIPSSPVATPKPTPQHTPPPSPIPHQVTPPATPDRSPSPSVASEPVVAPPTSERDESVKTDSEEERVRFMKILQANPLTPLQPVGEAVTLPDYEVPTPCSTAPNSPRQGVARTPSPSLQTATPERVQTPPAPGTPDPVLQEAEPQPWGNPDSTLSGEGLEPERVHDVAAGPEKPITFSVAIQADEEKPERLVSPPSRSPPPPSPPLRERELSISSQESPLSSSMVSDTINERISEGQWLLSFKSEGEVPGLQLDNDLRDRIKQRLLEGGRRTRAGEDDDTLLDTDDLEQDQDISDLPPSEGEFRPTASMFHTTAPMLAMMSQMNPQMGWTVTQPVQPGEMAVGVDMSLGEVRLGQSPQMTPHQEIALFNQSQPRKGTNMTRRSRGLLEEHKAMGGIHERDEQETSINSPDRQAQAILQPKMSTSTPVRGQGRTDLPDKPTIRGQGQGRPLMATVIPGGREPSLHYRPSTGPATRSRTMPMSRSLSPDMLSGNPKDRLPDTRLSQTSLHGTSELDTQTPDQMNVDALLQSRDYFGNTQSDLGSTAGDLDPGQSEKFSYSINRSHEFGVSRSGQFGASMGSTSDMSLAPGMTQTLERSEEELAQENRLSYTTDSDLLDLQAPGRPPGGRRGQDANGKKEPLQVSVTIPSMGEDSSGTQESYDDISELSLGGV